MKTILILLFAFSATLGFSQNISLEKGAIEMRADTISIEKAFAILDQIVPKKYFDRYVIQNGTTYYRPGIQWFRKRTYIAKNGNLFLLKEK